MLFHAFDFRKSDYLLGADRLYCFFRSFVVAPCRNLESLDVSGKWKVESGKWKMNRGVECL
jgi:hypothetical protein